MDGFDFYGDRKKIQKTPIFYPKTIDINRKISLTLPLTPNWINLVLCLMSVFLGCQAPTFFQFALETISSFRLINNLKKYDMENNILQWVGANMGSLMQFKESDKYIELNNHSWQGSSPSYPS